MGIGIPIIVFVYSKRNAIKDENS